MTVRAIYQNGVFRPKEPVDLPENCEVDFDPRMIETEQPRPTDAQFTHLDPGLARIYAILSERYDSGQHNLAEHQP